MDPEIEKVTDQEQRFYVEMQKTLGKRFSDEIFLQDEEKDLDETLIRTSEKQEPFIMVDISLKQKVCDEYKNDTESTKSDEDSRNDGEISSVENLENFEQLIDDPFENTIISLDIISELLANIPHTQRVDKDVQNTKTQAVNNFDQIEAEINNNDPLESTIICLDIISQILDRIPDIEYFSGESSDEYIPDSQSETSSISVISKSSKNRKKKNKSPIIVPESDSEEIFANGSKNFWEKEGIVDGKKRKQRKSNKERRVERQLRKNLKNSGLTYKTASGKLNPKREQKRLSKCRNTCGERIPETFRKDVFEYYWKNGDYNKRLQFISHCIDLRMKKTTSISGVSTRNRTNANKYTLRFSSAEYPICQSCLLKTLDEKQSIFRTAARKKVEENGIMEDKRGYNHNMAVISEERLKEVKEHIQSFQTYESHYGRSKTSKKFLPSDLNIMTMYNLYKDTTDNPVSKTIYTLVFHAQNLSFKRPQVDTCVKCDTLNAKIKVSTGRDLQNCQEQLQNHQKDAQERYDEKTSDTERAKVEKDLMVLTFDLQQCLPTPYLKSGAAFYKRQLWTYNLTIHDCATSTAVCYMWHEAIGARGGNEIASCLYHYLAHNVPSHVKYVIFYSDSCSGQNKNKYLIAMFMVAAQMSPNILEIEHKFMTPGHTHMECDSDHSLIERAKKKTSMNIHQPRDWYQLVRNASKNKNKFIVHEVTQEEILDFSSLFKGLFMARALNEEKEKFLISEAKAFRYKKGALPCFWYQNKDKDYRKVDFGRRKKGLHSYDFAELPRCYTNPLPISKEKKQDIMSLLDLIDMSARGFFLELTTDDSPGNIDPDLDYLD